MKLFQICNNQLLFCLHVQLLKKPDRSDNAESEKPKEKAKKPEKPLKEDRSLGGSDQKRRNFENKEDREKKSVSYFLLSYFYTFEQSNRADVVLLLPGGRKRGGRSSGSGTQIETENGTRIGGRERRSVPDVRTRKGGGGGNSRTERTPSRSEKRRLKRKKPRRGGGVKTCPTPTLRRWRNLPKTIKRRRVAKESACGIRCVFQDVRPSSH